MTAQQEREAFEAHMLRLNACTRLARQSDAVGGEYRTVTVERAWQLWQAARASLSLPSGEGWISVSERLPELGQSVALIQTDRWENAGDLEMNVRACGYLADAGPFKYWFIRGERSTSIDAFTHWLALPAAMSQGSQP